MLLRLQDVPRVVTAMRRPRDRACASCGRRLTPAAMTVLDVDARGQIATFHQRCAPAIAARRRPRV